MTIDIGANDGFVCEKLGQCSTQTQLQAELAHIAANLQDIFSQIRGTGYSGPLVLLDYYATVPYKPQNAYDATQLALTQALNQAINAATAGYDVIVADGFGAFATAAAAANAPNDDPCAAGLLIPLPDGTCNIHPSQLGHQVLAQAIETALAQAG